MDHNNNNKSLLLQQRNTKNFEKISKKYASEVKVKKLEVISELDDEIVFSQEAKEKELLRNEIRMLRKENDKLKSYFGGKLLSLTQKITEQNLQVVRLRTELSDFKKGLCLC